MGLGLKFEDSGDKEQRKLFKYDARSGELTYGTSDDPDILPDDFKFMIDINTIQTGYMKFSPPQDFSMLKPMGEGFGPNPEPGVKGGERTYNLGFKIRVYAKALEGVAYLMSNSWNTVKGIEAISDKWQAEEKDNEGKFPVIGFDLSHREGKNKPGREPQKKSTSTNYEPVFKIFQWAKPPAELLEPLEVFGARAEVETSAPAPTPAPEPSTASTVGEPEF